MTFKAGDLVMVICTCIQCSPNTGKLGVVVERCDCLLSRLLGLHGDAKYAVTGFDRPCFPGSTLRKIGGDRTITRITNDEPVEA